MRKASLLLLAGGLLTVASCKDESTTPGGMSQSQVDSAIQSKVSMALDSMATATDARITELATYMADSMMKAKQGIPVTTSRPAPITRNPRPTTPTTSTPKGGVNDRPGATNTGGAKPVTDRPGAINNSNKETPKPVSDRPGAIRQN